MMGSLILWPHYGPGSTQPLTDTSTIYIYISTGGKDGRGVGLTTSPSSFAECPAVLGDSKTWGFTGPMGILFSWRIYIPHCAFILIHEVKMWLKWKYIFGFISIRSQNYILVFWPTKLNAIRRLNPSLRLKCVSGRGGDARETS
jgi:hypothetical protein